VPPIPPQGTVLPTVLQIRNAIAAAGGGSEWAAPITASPNSRLETAANGSKAELAAYTTTMPLGVADDHRPTLTNVGPVARSVCLVTDVKALRIQIPRVMYTRGVITESASSAP